MHASNAPFALFFESWAQRQGAWRKADSHVVSQRVLPAFPSAKRDWRTGAMGSRCCCCWHSGDVL